MTMRTVDAPASQSKILVGAPAENDANNVPTIGKTIAAVRHA
jgi:hypothetical protein